MYRIYLQPNKITMILRGLSKEAISNEINVLEDKIDRLIKELSEAQFDKKLYVDEYKTRVQRDLLK